MRMTVTLDPDTEALVRREIARSGVTFERVLNEAIRSGLAGVRSGKRKQVEVRTFRSGYQPGIDRLRLQQLADDMEAAEPVGGRVCSPGTPMSASRSSSCLPFCG